MIDGSPFRYVEKTSGQVDSTGEEDLESACDQPHQLGSRLRLRAKASRQDGGGRFAGSVHLPRFA